VAPSDSQPSLPDWQELLVEAIQQRDADRAVMLAQRCVHRYGMPTLEALLERANRAGADVPDGDARTWLLPLLVQPSLAPDPSPAPEVPSEVPLQEQAPPPLSAKLDEAFGPLEIAFPPLPMSVVEAPPAVDSQVQPLALPSPPSGAFSGGLSGESSKMRVPSEERSDEPSEERSDEPSEKAGAAPKAQAAGEAPSALEAGASQIGFPLVEEDLAEEEAAPVPTFELQDPPPRQPSPRKVRHGERRGTIPPAPISPALEPWLAWLPGPYRPGARP